MFNVTSLSGLSGSDATVNVHLFKSGNSVLNGTFSVSYVPPQRPLSNLSHNNVEEKEISVIISTEFSGSKVQSLLFQLPGIFNISVEKLLSLKNEAIWEISFTSLQYILFPPNYFKISDSTMGIAEIKKISTLSSSQILNIIVMKNSSFSLFLNNVPLGNNSFLGTKIFNFDSSAIEIETILKTEISYVSVERIDSILTDLTVVREF